MSTITLAELKRLHKEHIVRKNRRESTAIAPLAAFYLVSRLDEMASELDRCGVLNILDLGSGFSSVAIRLWVQRWRAASHDEWIQVYTTDHVAKWLFTTLYELEVLDLPTEHVLLHEVFMQLPDHQRHKRFDFVFYDLADTKTRIAQAGEVVAMLRDQRSVLMLDDWHEAHYRMPMALELKRLGVEVTKDNLCKDKFERTMAEAALAGT